MGHSWHHEKPFPHLKKLNACLLNEWINPFTLLDQTCFPLNHLCSVHSFIKHLLSAYSVLGTKSGARERQWAKLARAWPCQPSILCLMAPGSPGHTISCHKTTPSFSHLKSVGSLIHCCLIKYLTFVLWKTFHLTIWSRCHLTYHKPPRLCISTQSRCNIHTPLSSSSSLCKNLVCRLMTGNFKLKPKTGKSSPKNSGNTDF